MILRKMERRNLGSTLSPRWVARSAWNRIEPLSSTALRSLAPENLNGGADGP